MSLFPVEILRVYKLLKNNYNYFLYFKFSVYLYHTKEKKIKYFFIENLTVNFREDF